MKRVLIALFLVFSMAAMSFAGYAKQGAIEFGGSMSYQSNEDTYDTGDTKSTLFTVAPEMFYYLDGNMAIGGLLEFQNSKYKASGYAENTTTTTTFFLEPMYVFDGKNVYPFVSFLVGLISSDSDGHTVSLTKYGVQGGVKVPIVKNGLMNVGLKYLMGTGEIYGDDVDTSDLKLSLGFSLFY